MCPDSDPDVRALRQEISKSVDALEKQIKLLGQRLLRSRLRLNELETGQKETQKKILDVSAACGFIGEVLHYRIRPEGFTIMKAQYRCRVLDLEMLRPANALSWLFASSSSLMGKSGERFSQPRPIFNFECVTGGHGRCVSDACDCPCHRRNTG
jgi:hypothetical protein